MTCVLPVRQSRIRRPALHFRRMLHVRLCVVVCPSYRAACANLDRIWVVCTLGQGRSALWYRHFDAVAATTSRCRGWSWSRWSRAGAAGCCIAWHCTGGCIRSHVAGGCCCIACACRSHVAGTGCISCIACYCCIACLCRSHVADAGCIGCCTGCIGSTCFIHHGWAACQGAAFWRHPCSCGVVCISGVGGCKHCYRSTLYYV